MAQSQNQNQQQWQGPERRQLQGSYTGEERRRQQPPHAPVVEPSPDDGTRPMRTQARKDEQEERSRQQQKDQSDTH